MKKEMKLFTITSFLICSFIGLTSAQSNNEVLAYKDLLAEKRRKFIIRQLKKTKMRLKQFSRDCSRFTKISSLPKMGQIACSTPHVQNTAYWQ